MSKQMKKYVIADLNINMATEYERTRRQAESYCVSEDSWPEDEGTTIDVSQFIVKDIEEGISKNMSPEMMEYMYSGSLFYRKLLSSKGLLIHSSAVVVDGYAYLFSADSGTGKSTHTGLWIEYFKDKAFIINDDKPAVRKVDGAWYAYGTPWSGKTDKNVNARAKLGGIVFLERSPNNWIEDMSPAEAIPKLIAQTTRKLNKETNMDFLVENINELLLQVPLYKMGCNISQDAVKMAYEKIRKV